VGLAGCAPAYVWSDAEKVEHSLGKIVPIGASQTELLAVAKIRSWEVDSLNIKIAGIGKATWFDDCPGRGGFMVPVIIERYATPFETTVESMWLFDEYQKLADICVRKTTDAL
jgi:hypothetical protein